MKKHHCDRSVPTDFFQSYPVMPLRVQDPSETPQLMMQAASHASRLDPGALEGMVQTGQDCCNLKEPRVPRVPPILKLCMS